MYNVNNMKISFLLLTVFVCEIICQKDTTEAVAQEDSETSKQEIESKETVDPKTEIKEEGSTESARGDSTTNVADTFKKVEQTTPSAEKPRDDENAFGEEGTVVEANPNPQPQSPSVDPFYIYSVPSYWPGYPPAYPVYPSYPAYPGYNYGYPIAGYNPWLQQRTHVCPPEFTLVYDHAGHQVCHKTNIFHNLYAAAARLQ